MDLRFNLLLHFSNLLLLSGVVNMLAGWSVVGTYSSKNAFFLSVVDEVPIGFKVFCLLVWSMLVSYHKNPSTRVDLLSQTASQVHLDNALYSDSQDDLLVEPCFLLYFKLHFYQRPHCCLHPRNHVRWSLHHEETMGLLNSSHTQIRGCNFWIMHRFDLKTTEAQFEAVTH